MKNLIELPIKVQKNEIDVYIEMARNEGRPEILEFLSARLNK